MRTIERRRVVVDLGAATLDPLALRAAVELAELAGSEFAALFVEDINLFHLGSLPFAAEIGLASAAWRPLATADVERSLRLQAGRLQRALEEAARELAIAWSFAVARGTPLASLLEARGDMLVIPGTAGGRDARHGDPEQALRQAFLGGRQGGAGRRGPVAVVLGAGMAADRALESAQALARSRATEVLVIATAGAVELGRGPVPDVPVIRMIRLPDLIPETLARALSGAQALFWPVTTHAGAAREIDAVRRLLDCPLVLIR